ncbi:cation transport protein-domain-containing protein [Nemania sp. NC0429]|nr:cation transport protein-domain-containing protein [Nemania sp. NC0429]
MANIREHLVRWAQAIRPGFFSKHPHFDFLTIHYFWIIGWAIIGSVLIYAPGRGGLAYIDALTFAAGANTQAGLNTVDLNRLNTFQQAVIYICSLLSNPITIHSFVVFLRLYWFERTFQHTVAAALSRRVTIGKSRSKAQPDSASVERGLSARDIGMPVRSTDEVMGLDKYSINGALKPDPLANTSGSEDGSEHVDPSEEARSTHAQIKFANDVRRSDAIEEVEDDDDDHVPLPTKRPNADHIAILEKQRKADKSVLRIPGPRDADRGAVPEEFEEGAEEGVEGDTDTAQGGRDSNGDRLQMQTRPSQRDGERQQTIIITEPDKPRKDDPSPSNIPEDAEQDSINPLRRIRTVLSQNKEMDSMPYLSWQPTIGRNSQFIDLTEDQREELGGIEYRALKTLALILIIYFWGYSLFGIITLVPWILHNNPQYSSIIKADGINPVWWAFWTANSAFMDLGLTLTPDSMNSFSTAIFPLLIMSFLIILGNTGFPVALRFMIWLASLMVPRGSGLWEELRFLLDHPRRCFTLLFPSNANWWLTFILVALNAVDLLLFIVLDLSRGAISMLPLNIRFLNGWFQAVSTRTAGFSSVNLAELHPAVQTSYLIMMYISVFPVAISIRQTNVYEEKSLGVYETGNDVADDDQPSISYLGTHLRRQLSFDLWYVFLGYFFLTITEGPRIISGEISMFAVLFEIVSAYGTVGMSLGYPNTNASLCAQFSVLGKLIIIAMMIRGRHRGLPYGLDRAILLPSEDLNRKEAEDAELRLQRRQSGLSVAPADRRPSSRRDHSLNIDRQNVIARLMQVGPTFSMSKSDARLEQASGSGRSDTLTTFTSATSFKTRKAVDQRSGDLRFRRAESQPIFSS